MNPHFLNMNEIEVKVFKDGQVSYEVPENSEIVTDIQTRISSYDDLFKLAAVVDAHRSWVKEPINLYIKYLIGARSDRRFSPVGSFDLKPVTDFINRLNFKRVYVFEPHSDVTLALLDNSYSVPFQFWNFQDQFDVVVTPDAGAYKRVMHNAKYLVIPVVSANKYRDDNNNPHVVFSGSVVGKRCMIVDDLCDGGRTFATLSQELYAAGAADVGLAVAHGLFTYGFEPLTDAGITKIITTNSYQDIPFPEEYPFLQIQKVI